MSFALTAEQERQLEEILGRYPNKMAACIPVLHLCQEANDNWVSEEVIDFVAQQPRPEPGSRRRASSPSIRSSTRSRSASTRSGCAAPSPARCAASDQILAHCEKRLGCHAGETSKDGKVTLRTAECLASLRHRPHDAGRQDRTTRTSPSSRSTGSSTGSSRPSVTSNGRIERC